MDLGVGVFKSCQEAAEGFDVETIRRVELDDGQAAEIGDDPPFMRVRIFGK